MNKNKKIEAKMPQKINKKENQTVYYLTVCPTENGYTVYESHKGQCKGCFETEPEIVNYADNKEEVNEIINNFKKVVSDFGNILDGVEWRTE